MTVGIISPLTPAPAIARARGIKTLRVGLLGLGVVGQGLVRLVRERDATLREAHGVALEIERALVRDVSKPRSEAGRGIDLVADPGEFLSHEYDVVVEAIGGVEPAHTLVASLLARGTPVVSGNKTLLAARGDDLREIGAAARTVLAYEASVAAGIPVLRLLETSLKTNRVASVTAILNGTSNYVLTRVCDSGADFADALDQAVRSGFAEADPSLDLDGRDAAQKLCVLWRDLHGAKLTEQDIVIDAIRGVTAEDGRWAKRLQLRLKPIAWAAGDREHCSALVAPAVVSESHPLANVRDEQNGIVLRGDTIPELFLAGPGAGAIPTASAILDDILAIHNGIAAATAVPRPTEAPVRIRQREWPRFVRLRFTRADEVLDDVQLALHRHQASFTRLRECREGREGREERGLTLAGLVTPLDDARCAALLRDFNEFDGCEQARAYRVIA